MTEQLTDRIVEAVMARRHAASGIAVFVDPVVLRDIVEKELATLRAALAERQWQDIATVPHNADVLVYWNDQIYSGQFIPEIKQWALDGRSLVGSRAAEPTHWMPLPAPPVVTDGPERS